MSLPGTHVIIDGRESSLKLEDAELTGYMIKFEELYKKQMGNFQCLIMII